MKVYQAISAVQAELAKAGIGKDSENKYDGYKFRGIDAVYNALCPLLAKHQLCILPRMLARTCEERTSQKGGALFYVTVDAEFDFVSAEDGTKHTVKTFGEAMDRGDKATNKAMSAAYKYAAFQAFAIPTEGDNDADAQSHEVETKQTHSPTDGITLPPDRKEYCDKLFSRLVDFMDAKMIQEAHDELYALPDNDEILYVWGRLKPHSKFRKAIKDLHDTKKEAA